MNTPQFTLQSLFFIVNSFTVAFITWFVCRMHNSMNSKLDLYMDYMRHVSDRNDIVYINQLGALKNRLMKEERYEEAKEVQEMINNELKTFKDNESRGDKYGKRY